jgi:hypothetical protein
MHPQVINNIPTNETKETTSENRKEQRESKERSNKTLLTHLSSENILKSTEKLLSRNTNEYPEDIIIHMTPNSKTSSRSTLDHQDRSTTIHTANKTTTRSKIQRTHNYSSSSSLDSTGHRTDKIKIKGAFRQQNNNNTPDNLSSDDSKQHTTPLRYQQTSSSEKPTRTRAYKNLARTKSKYSSQQGNLGADDFSDTSTSISSAGITNHLTKHHNRKRTVESNKNRPGKSISYLPGKNPLISTSVITSQTPSSPDITITTSYNTLHQDSSSDASSTRHCTATREDFPHASYNTRTSTKQKSQQKQFDDVSSLDYSSSNSSDITQKQLRPTTTIYPTTNTQNRKAKTNKLSSEWAKIFSGCRRGTTTTTPRTQTK